MNTKPPILRRNSAHALRASVWVSAILLFFFTATVSAQPENPVTVQIDPSVTYQTVEGFGASGAWWHTWVKDYPQDEREQLLRLLYTDEGAGLTVFRYNIPAGAPDTVERPDRKTIDIETAPGEYNFDADREAILLLKDIRALGVTDIVVFANSPPARLTRNGKTSGGDEGGSNLKPGAEAEFATYLVDVAEHLRTELDLEHLKLSPINEPQWDWGKGRGQEGCHYEPDEVARTIRAVVDEVQSRGVPIEVEAPESGAWEGSEKYAEALFADPVLDEYFHTFALHSYWSDRRKKRAFREWFDEHHPDKTISMTEYCEMRHGHGTGIEEGLHLAKVMHDDFTLGRVVTWQWWLAIAGGGYNDGLIYAHPRTQEIETTKRLWVMAHYARFVRPGSKRIDVSLGGDDLDILASGYVSEAGDRMAVVLTNPSDADVVVRWALPSDQAWAVDAAYFTDADRDLEHAADTNTESLTLPARSICTVVYRSE